MVRDLDMKLKMLRIQLRKTQKAVSRETNIDSTTLSSYETGNATPSAENLAKLAAYYHTSVDYLLGIEKRRTILIDGNMTEDEFADLLQVVDIYCKHMGHKRPAQSSLP